MVLLLEGGDQIIPHQTSELIVSSGDRLVSSLVVGTLALCTDALEAQVGQEGIGEADQMPGCNCRPRGRFW